MRACTGTACWAADFGAHVRALGAGHGEVVCLGFCHSAGAVRDGDLVDAGPGAVARVLAGAARQAEEPAWASDLAEPVLLRPGDCSGLQHAVAHLTPAVLLGEVKAANLRGRGGAGFPAGVKWELARRAPGAESRSSSTATRATPAPTSTSCCSSETRRSCSRAQRSPASRSVRTAGSSTSAPNTRARGRPRGAIAAAEAAGRLGDDIAGSGFSFHVTVVEGAGSYVVGEETALLNSVAGLRGTVSARPPFPAERG